MKKAKNFLIIFLVLMAGSYLCYSTYNYDMSIYGFGNRTGPFRIVINLLQKALGKTGAASAVAALTLFVAYKSYKSKKE
jgi:hypothetical protein